MHRHRSVSGFAPECSRVCQLCLVTATFVHQPLLAPTIARLGSAEAGADVVQVTVERRLYDIGSILSSANLIKKSYLGRKRCESAPVFA